MYGPDSVGHQLRDGQRFQAAAPTATAEPEVIKKGKKEDADAAKDDKKKDDKKK